MGFDDWLAKYLTPDQLSNPKNVMFCVDDLREAWDAAAKEESDRCDEIRDSEARDMDRD